MKVIETLDALLEEFQDETRFCVGRTAQTADGQWTFSWDPLATAHCTLGFIGNAFVRRRISDRTEEQTRAFLQQAANGLGSRTIATQNDQGIEAARAMIRRAKELAHEHH